jgi:hypothetical protein
MELTSENVERTVLGCLFDEKPTGIELSKAVVVEGIVRKYGFDPEKLKNHEEDIFSMLKQLPKSFMKSCGGGMTFLDACYREDGIQWTGFHQSMEALFCLGIAIKKVQFSMPKDMWSILPGGVPYLMVDDT